MLIRHCLFPYMVKINTKICRKSGENVEKISRITLGIFPDFCSSRARLVKGFSRGNEAVLGGSFLPAPFRKTNGHVWPDKGHVTLTRRCRGARGKDTRFRSLIPWKFCICNSDSLSIHHIPRLLWLNHWLDTSYTKYGQCSVSKSLHKRLIPLGTRLVPTWPRLSERF